MQGWPPERSACTTFATAATLWLAAGESIYFVQQQLGHADIQTTIDQYGHPDKQPHREAAGSGVLKSGFWSHLRRRDSFHDVGHIEIKACI